MRILQTLWRWLRTSKYDTLTLGQLITLAAHEPTQRNRNAVYRRLLFSRFGARTPGCVIPQIVGPYMVKRGDGWSLYTVQADDGATYFWVYCEVPSMLAQYPNDHFAEIDARTVFEMAVSGGFGVIVQNRDEFSICVPNEDVAGILSGAGVPMMTVPPQHKLVVFTSSPTCNLARCESGVYIAQFGYLAGIDEVITGVRNLVAWMPNTAVLWVLHPVILESKTAFETVLSALDATVHERGYRSHSVVAPYAVDRHVPQLKRIKAVGVAVHFGGPYGECLMEIHKPEGIALAMPGRRFK